MIVRPSVPHEHLGRWTDQSIVPLPSSDEGQEKLGNCEACHMSMRWRLIIVGVPSHQIDRTWCLLPEASDVDRRSYADWSFRCRLWPSCLDVGKTEARREKSSRRLSIRDRRRSHTERSPLSWRRSRQIAILPALHWLRPTARIRLRPSPFLSFVPPLRWLGLGSNWLRMPKFPSVCPSRALVSYWETLAITWDTCQQR